MFALATPQGWCVDEHGMVVDPTCDDPAGVEYFGIAFDSKQVAQLRRRSTEASCSLGYGRMTYANR